MGKKHKLKRTDNETRRRILARIKFGKVNNAHHFTSFINEILVARLAVSKHS